MDPVLRQTEPDCLRTVEIHCCSHGRTRPVNHLGRIAVAVGLCWFAPYAPAADDVPPDQPSPVQDNAAHTAPTPVLPPSRWHWDLETSYVFHTIPNPWWSIAMKDANYKNFNNYHLETTIAGLRNDLTEPSGWRFLRGNVQGSFGLIYSDITQGPENIFIGVVAGFRYNFVPGDGTWSPYAELRGVAGYVDACKCFYGQQSNTTFGYIIGFGLRYQPNPLWRAWLDVEDHHLSDLYMTQNNFGFDSVGPGIGVERRF